MRLSVPLASGAKTPRGALEHDALSGMGDRRWRWKGRPQPGSSRPTWRRWCSCPEPTYTTDRGVMDNLGAHTPKRIGQLIERQGCELLSLCRPTPPTTQPHRRGLRQAKTTAARQGRGQEQRGPGRSDSSGALSAITTAEAKGFFEHAGYRPAGQLP